MEEEEDNNNNNNNNNNIRVGLYRAQMYFFYIISGILGS